MEIACHFQYISYCSLLQSWCILPVSEVGLDKCYLSISKRAMPLEFLAVYAFSIRYLELIVYFTQ